MSNRSPNLIGGVCGLLAIVFSIGGFSLIGAAGLAVEGGAPRDEVTEALADANADLALAGIYIDTLGSLFFVLFLAALWRVFGRAEGEGGWLAVGILVAGVLTIAAGLGDKGAFYAILIRADDGLDPDVAAGLYSSASGFFNIARAFGGLFALLGAIAVWRTGVLGRWMGWVGLVSGVVGIASAVAPESSLAQSAFPFFPLWIAAVSISLIVRRERPSEARQAVPQGA